jgi:signal transduction histidine kinase
MSAAGFKTKIAFFSAFPSLVCAVLVLALIAYLTDLSGDQMNSVFICAGLLTPVMVVLSIWFDRRWQAPLIGLIEECQQARALPAETIHELHWRALRFPIYTYLFNLCWWLGGTALGAALFAAMGMRARDVFYIFMSGLSGGILSALVQFHTVKIFLWKTINPIFARADRSEAPYVQSPLSIRSKLLLSFVSVIAPSLLISNLLAYSMIFKELKRHKIEHHVLLGRAMASELARSPVDTLDWASFRRLLDRFEALGLTGHVLLLDRTGRKLFGASPLSLAPRQLEELLAAGRDSSLNLDGDRTVLSFFVGEGGPVLLLECPWGPPWGPLVRIPWVFIGGAFMLLVALILVTSLSSHDIARPLLSLRDLAHRVGEGVLDTTVQVFSDDETGELSWLLQKMTNRLKDSSRILEEKVRERTESLERANRELKALNKVKDEFLSSVSHELRTPLTSIRSFSEILLRYPDESEQTKKEFLEIIHSESQRLTRLINELLDLAKIQSGKMKWNDEKLDVEEVLTSVLNALRVIVEGKGLAMHVKVYPNLPPVWMDRDRLVQVITNLISNAVKFTDPGGSIHIAVEPIVGKRLRDRDGLVKFCVADTGVGIPEKDQKLIFEKFVQVEVAPGEKPRGTGLGLAICKDIVAHYGGEIWVESAPGRGSRFCFTIPCSPPAVGASDED